MSESDPFQQASQNLQHSLDQRGQLYELIERVSMEHVRIRFTGLFHNTQVIWNANIYTLQNRFRHGAQSSTYVINELPIKQCIDICENTDSYDIDIALNLSQIDQATIKRTIIMVRKYKRLHLGRHEYGETITFKPD